MAVTKIWPVKGRLDAVIRYAGNEEKTRLPDLTVLSVGKDDLGDVLQYAANDAKTARESQLFVSGVNCVPEIARQQMELTKQQFGKTGGTVAFHAYQSFCPGEVTPEQCHAIGVELAKRVWGERFQVLVATHLNTNCCHNHFVINSVSFVDGKRYNDCKKTYRALQDVSDELCREQGLSVVDKKDAHRVPRNIYLAEKAGEPTRYNVMRQDIDLAILRSETPRDLPRILRKMGYEVDFNPNHKYATIKLPHDRRAVRFKTLGEEYTPQAMSQRIQQNHAMGIFQRMEIYNKRYPPVHPHYQKLRQDFRKAIMEAFGIYRTYLYYCYLLGKLPTTTPNYSPPHPAMREDSRRWAEIEKQLHLLERHSLNTAEDIAAFTSEQEQKLAALETRRTKCRNRLRRCCDPTEGEALHTEKNELTKQITQTRKELHTAQQIPDRVKRMRENIQLWNDREQQRTTHRKER